MFIFVFVLICLLYFSRPGVWRYSARARERPQIRPAIIYSSMVFWKTVGLYCEKAASTVEVYIYLYICQNRKAKT